MGKPRMDLLKGIEEQENAIESSKAYQEEEAFLNLLRQGKSRKEAYEAIGREKTWASKTIKKIRETEPERLRGTAEEIKDEAPAEQPTQDTPQTPQKPQTAPEPHEPIKSTPTEEKAEEKPNTKQKKQVFSFRATLDNIADWKAYATATGQTMENVGTAAMNEYLDRHKLTGAEQAIFEAMKSKNEK